MASRAQIFGILAGASAPMNRLELEEKVGESYRRFQTQLDRWVKQELIEDVGDHHYVLTDKGRDEALLGEFENIGTGTLPKELTATGGVTQETTQTTEYQQFLRLGMNVGVVPLNLIKVATDHIWNGGDYEDLRWVATGLQQMGIQRDLANRWLHAWGSHLKQPLPTDLPHEFLAPEERRSAEEAAAARKQGAGKRDYILDADDQLVYLGVGKGTMDYQDAMDLAKLRTARKKDAAAATPGSMAEEVTKVFTAFKELMGDKVVGKSYIVKPGDNGYQVEEVDANKPLLIQPAGGAQPSPSFYIDSEGKTQELKPGQPVVIFKEAVKTAPASQQYLINQTTGAVQEIIPGTPIVIKTEPAPGSQTTPIQLKDKEGNPIILDIGTYIRLEEHKEKQRRDEESHEVKIEIAKGFKDLLRNAQAAFSHMGEEGK